MFGYSLAPVNLPDRQLRFRRDFGLGGVAGNLFEHLDQFRRLDGRADSAPESLFPGAHEAFGDIELTLDRLGEFLVALVVLEKILVFLEGAFAISFCLAQFRHLELAFSRGDRPRVAFYDAFVDVTRFSDGARAFKILRFSEEILGDSFLIIQFGFGQCFPVGIFSKTEKSFRRRRHGGNQSCGEQSRGNQRKEAKGVHVFMGKARETLAQI